MGQHVSEIQEITLGKRRGWGYAKLPRPSLRGGGAFIFQLRDLAITCPCTAKTLLIQTAMTHLSIH